ncbi:tetratricopeptide repeat protein [Paraburkholderia phymatum]|uniref:Tetratricopeptide TPR_2 repeat protein n=1 Tax=Paraburkholderia phymatum (strain DSM 17167 / CIP 108236 / LMG 21445 / STM815) TaxID=391038 RepID=B2JMX4_PARP8|nr:tetratricopeptide repeat protein [Paraburkholderia phymatum]ACC74367.1 Tetratricopeptide TPR_2 repeat protein [Paraburkholderia phymatum STM815]
MSTSPATPDRERLFSPAVLLVLGLLVGVMLALAFPREKIESRLLAGAKVDSLTIAYLEAWLRVDPNNADVLSELTREYLTGQRISDATHVLERLSHSSDANARQRALAIRVSIAQQRLYALKSNDPTRPARIRELDALLHEALDYQWDNEQLNMLAQQARGLSDNDLAARYYTVLAKSDPEHAREWLAALAQTQLGNQQHRAAADAWFAAQAQATSRDEERAAFIAGLKALQSGNDMAATMQAADQHIGDLADDPDTLRFLANLALAAGRPDLAAKYVKRLMKMSGLERERALSQAASYEPRRTREPALSEHRATHRVWLHAAWYRPHSSRAAALRRALSKGSEEDTQGAHLVRIAAAEPPAPASDATAADYELAYRVFLANGDVANAQRIAQSAVDRDPLSIGWRERLAQVAEWNRRQDIALANYVAIAKMRGTDDDWKKVARLAPGLNDNAAMLAVMLHQADRQPGNVKLLDAVVFSYERVADPDSALRFLQSRFKGALRREAMERYAQVAESKGDDELALRTWRELERSYGPNAAYGLKIGTMLYTRTQFDAALAAMNEAKRAAPASNNDFWRFYALLADSNQSEHDARLGYRQLIAGGKADPQDYEVMTNFFHDSPLDAGRLAEYAYRHGGSTRMLSEALYGYQRAHAWGRIGTLLASLTPEQLQAAEQSPAFLLARAEYERQAGENDAALHDIERAVTLDPNNSEARAAHIWVLNERGTDAALLAALRRHADDAETDPPLWPAYAAAWLRIGDGRKALHYLHKQAAQAKQGPLWRLTFADALELNGRADEAWRVRKQAWMELARRRRDPSSATQLSAAEQDELRGRYTALTQLYADGDRSRAVLIDMLRADRNATGSDDPAGSELGDIGQLPPAKQDDIRKRQRLYSSIAREAAISWAQNEDASDMERAWLEKQYIDDSQRPVYAEAQLAINDGDVNELARLLDTLPDLVPRQSRVDAQALTGRTSAAQTSAFESLTREPDDEVMQALAREQLLSNAQALAGAFRYVDQGSLRFTEESATGSVRLTPSQNLQFRYQQRDQTVDGSQLAYAPKHDRLAEAIYGHKGPYDEQRVTLGRRNALEDFTTARIEGTYNVTQRLTLTYALGYDQAATESTQLTAGGTKDLATLGFNYRLDPHWFGGARYEYARFRGQDRSYLGNGGLVEANLGYKIKADYPDYTIRVVFAHGQYNATGTPGERLRVLLPDNTPFTAASFMPQTFTQGGLLFSFGDDLPEQYSKGWRPMFTGGPIRDSRAGWSGQAGLGIAGSVFGHDQMLIYGAYQGVSSNHSTSVKEVGARYRYLY